jgi:hypothetical protein
MGSDPLVGTSPLSHTMPGPRPSASELHPRAIANVPTCAIPSLADGVTSTRPRYHLVTYKGPSRGSVSPCATLSFLPKPLKLKVP